MGPGLPLQGGSQGCRVFYGVSCFLQMQKQKSGRERGGTATCGQPSAPREEIPTGCACWRARSLLQAAANPSSADKDAAKKALWAQTGWSWAPYESGLWPRALYNNKQLVWSWEAFPSIRHRDWNYFLFWWSALDPQSCQSHVCPQTSLMLNAKVTL